MTSHRCRTRVRKEDGAMPSLDCPTCDGRGYVQGDDGETTICARCEGTGVVFVDDDTGAARRDVRD
jgi:DnaJ-class molecular chaperone